MGVVLSSQCSAYVRFLCTAGISAVEYRPDAAVDDVMYFKYYNPQQVVMGKTMEEWLRFSVCFWHTFRGTGKFRIVQPPLPLGWISGNVFKMSIKFHHTLKKFFLKNLIQLKRALFESFPMVYFI